ncbi:S-adenosyl-L-methionine-dependent methyltransferase [Fomitiporia mediterranea MF3/22]|uniref:S-adenosyl-L-methionine-dependent methyltransferase n=1 Tax=Fomitiporia mediterranea (strain MF3/22) TaxID=694068 RepID=UPI00044094B7|nr:S-adenosyl-L-methionine-dependent methyltransferase [Fomitiporia mediterranea MF3/22]EJD02255.1 S-adenosyl-L-methionine-dependent methyltransferase [Fomitiporia mediterranea MF3/22]
MSPQKRRCKAEPLSVHKKCRILSKFSSSIYPSPMKSASFDSFGNSMSCSTTNSGKVNSLTSSEANKYIALEDELEEDDDLCALLGETDPVAGDDRTIPVRVLSFFDVYDYESEERKVLPMDVNTDEDTAFYGASGLVRPQLQLENEDEDWFTDLQADVWTDASEIWIRTHFAWYILEYPSRMYWTYFDKVKVLARAHARRPAPPALQEKGPLVSFVTPRVGSIAQGLFLQSLIMTNGPLSMEPSLQNVCVPNVPFVVHPTAPETITWGQEITGTRGCFKSVFVDGVEYHINDTVAVSAPGLSIEGEGGKTTPRNSSWFGIIIYFFDKTGRRSDGRSKSSKYFHLRWFDHGSRTVLGETASPQALFLLDKCDNNPVETILQKITVCHLGTDVLEPVVIPDNDAGPSSFHLSYKWDEEKMTMSTVDFQCEKSPKSSTERAYAAQLEHKKCYSCAVKDSSAHQTSERSLPRTLEIYDKHYHVFDFVYVKEKDIRHRLLGVAQIVNLPLHRGDSQVMVTFFGRSRCNSDDKTPILQRSLFPTGKLERIPPERLDGHCFVSEISDIDDLDAWLEGPDNFVVENQKRSLRQCIECLAARKAYLECEEFIKRRPLRAMNLFSGASGLTVGMDHSGFVKTCWAVEHSPSTARSLKANHEGIIVYNRDCNDLLKYAVDLEAGKRLPDLLSLGPEKEVLPSLPRPGEVDLIMGGPPCQPYTGLNRFKRIDDIRQTCIPTLLSYVEFYSPKYVLIENVTSILHYRLKGRQEGRKIVGGVEGGMVKFIVRTLTSLGYQCSLKVLNSVDYGSPHQRKCVFFWAARRDLLLPKWPIPTHIPRRGHNTVNRRITNNYQAPLASRDGRDVKHERAPFYAVTVKEAIDDLLPWDWENPGIFYPAGARRLRSLKPAFPAAAGIRRVDTEDAQVSGYGYPVRYASVPRTLYQAFCRKGQGEFTRVYHHCTSLFSVKNVERTVNVPIRPCANFKDLPQPLRVGSGNKRGRLWKDLNGQFHSLQTTIHPGARNAYIIHPTDRRVLTLRELARAQGFPDDYEFCSVKERADLQLKDIERQIACAVPVQQAYALGRGLGESLIQAEMDSRLERMESESTTISDVQSTVSEEL